MRMFLESSAHSKYLFDCVAERPSKIVIASFGIYAGISFAGQDTTKWGEKYRLATRDLLESMRSGPQVQLLIGVAEYRGCKGERYCKDCEMQYAKGLFRLAYHADLFPQFEWRISTSLHLKCAIFYGKDGTIKGVAGGRNFTDSNWADVTFELTPEHATELANHTKELWDKSPKLDDSAIDDILQTQNINSKTMEAIVLNAEAGH